MERPKAFSRKFVLRALASQAGTRRKGSQGFTLIELLVVIVILGVLGAVGYPTYLAQLQRANENTAQNAAMAAAKACAALQVTDETAAFNPGADAVTPATCDTTNPQTFSASFGSGATLGQGSATVISGGAVVAGTGS